MGVSVVGESVVGESVVVVSVVSVSVVGVSVWVFSKGCVRVATVSMCRSHAQTRCHCF